MSSLRQTRLLSPPPRMAAKFPEFLDNLCSRVPLSRLTSRFRANGHGETPTTQASQYSLESVFEGVLEEHGDEDRMISEEERVILHKMLGFGDRCVSDIMVPRTDIIAVDYQITMSELKEVIAREQHTRMPVYDDVLDRLMGFIHLKDLVPMLAGHEPFDIDTILREVYFISPSMRLVDLLVHMRVSGHHLAIVVDEYGGTDGLVTLEDIFEALVGDIQDEHDIATENTPLRRQLSHQFDIDARMRVDQLEDAIGLDLHEVLVDEDFDTVGGFIFASLQRVPVVGEIITIPDLGRIKIIDADPRRIRRIQLTLNYTPLPATMIAA